MRWLLTRGRWPFLAAVLAAIEEATRRHGVAADQVTFLAHATTVVTNALLEARGARTALITTRGLRDVLELRRSARASLYDMFQDGPAILVPRHLRLEVRRRLDEGDACIEWCVRARPASRVGSA